MVSKTDSIDGPTALSYSDNVPMRFEAYGWHTTTVSAYDMPAIAKAIEEAQAVTDRPSLIICKSHIAYGSPNKQDTAEAHGSPLGADEVRATKVALGLPADEQFWVPDEVYGRYRAAVDEGAKREADWLDVAKRYGEADPGAGEAFKLVLERGLPAG